MNRLVAACLSLLVAACWAAPAAEPFGPGPPVVQRVAGPLFDLTLVSDASVYRAGAPIQVDGHVAYHGPKAAERIFHAAQPISIGLRQLDGPAEFEPVMAMPCASTDLPRGALHVVPFVKGGIVNDHGPFDLAWFKDPALRLPPGTWRFTALLSVTPGDCGNEEHELEASIDIVVAP